MQLNSFEKFDEAKLPEKKDIYSLLKDEYVDGNDYEHARARSTHFVDASVYGGLFFEKKVFYLLAPPKQMSLLPISNENILSKTQVLDYMQ